MKRRNKQFVQNIKETEPYSIKKDMYDWLIIQVDGATFGETYTKFNYYSPRYIREVIRNLKDLKLLTTKICRCHKASIYYGVKK